jgi:nitrile hydratase subunit beta
VNGIHDLGGMQGFGRVEREEREPVFHARWEGRVRAMMTAGLRLGLYNLDEFRWALERMDPAQYLAAGYYEKWLSAIERLYVEKGVVTREELDDRLRHEGPPSGKGEQPGRRGVLTPAPSEPPGTVREPPRFAPGDAVIARNIHPRTHTRLPRYARGKQGVVHRLHGAYVFPDRSAVGLGQHLEYVYSIRFDARELWGPDAPAHDRVHIDLWEPYLERRHAGERR